MTPLAAATTFEVFFAGSRASVWLPSFTTGNNPGHRSLQVPSNDVSGWTAAPNPAQSEPTDPFTQLLRVAVTALGGEPKKHYEPPGLSSDYRDNWRVETAAEPVEMLLVSMILC